MKILTIPNIITGLNAVCGCIAIVFALQGNLVLASIFIFSGALLDFCDGFFARLLKQYSEIGKELDSLSDMVSFGVAPSMIMVALVNIYLNKIGIVNTQSVLEINFNELPMIYSILLFSPFLIVIFSGLRLAKFNLDTRQTESFIGLTTTANGILIGGLAFFPENSIYREIITSVYFIVPFVLVQSILLISEIPMFSLKIKNFTFTKNKERFIFLFYAISLIILLSYKSISVIIFSYIFYSVLKKIFSKN